MSILETNGVDQVVGIGEREFLRGYALTGIVVYPAQTPDDIRAAWDGLPEGTALVLLTADAASVLQDRLNEPTAPLVAVLPDLLATAAMAGPA